MQTTPPRRNRLLDGPRAVKISVSFPEDVAAALDEATEVDHRHNRSALIVEAVVAWLNRTFDRRAA